MKKRLTVAVALLTIFTFTGCAKDVGLPITDVDYSYKQQLEPQDVVSNKVVQQVIVDETKADPDESYTWKALRDRLGISFLEDKETERIFAATQETTYDIDKSGLLKTDYVTEPLKGSDGNLYLYLKGDYYLCDEDGYVEVCVTNCETLNFRVGPSTGNDIIGTVQKGNHTWAKSSAHMSDGSTWYRVKNKDGQLGWQHSYYLQLTTKAVKKPADVTIIPAVEVNTDGELVVSYPEFDKSKQSLTAAYVFTQPEHLKNVCISCGQTVTDCEENGCKVQMLGKKNLKADEERKYYKSFDEVKAEDSKAKESDYGWFWVDTEECDNCTICSHVPCLEGLSLEYTLALDKAEKDDGKITIALPDKQESSTNTEESQQTEQKAHEYVKITPWQYFTEAKTAADKTSDNYWPQTIKRYQDEDTVVFTGAGFHNEQIDLSTEDLVVLKFSTDSLTTTSKDPYYTADNITTEQMLNHVCGYVLLDNAEVWALIPLYDYETGTIVKHGWVYVTTLLSAEEYIEQSYSWLRFFEDFGYEYKSLTAEQLKQLGVDKATSEAIASSFIGNSRLTTSSVYDIWMYTFGTADNTTTAKERYVLAALEWLNNLKRETALQ